MLKRTNKIAAAAVSLTLLANIANGAGFALYEFSARGNAMGGAVMANKAEPASIATNPALITELKGTQAQVGVTFVNAHATTSVNGIDNNIDPDTVHSLPNFYITHESKKENVYFGLAGYSRFGLGAEYTNYKNWPTSVLTGQTQAYKVNVQSFSIVPEIAVKASDELSIAMGLEMMTLSFAESTYATGAHPLLGSMGENNMDISGSGVSWGGNFGILYKPEWASKWGFGASYKTKMRQVLDGRIEGSGRVFGAGGLNDMNGDVRGSVTLPDMIMAGVSFAPSNKFLIEAGIVSTFWSSYDAIRIDYKDEDTSIIDTKNYKDAIRVNLGAEYSVTNNWDLRLGYVFDQSPINDQHMDNLVPADDRHIFNGGFGYHNDVWGVDASYSYLLAKDLEGVNNQGQKMEYTNGSSNIVGLTFSYKFN